jgi:hypothetical protein
MARREPRSTAHKLDGRSTSGRTTEEHGITMTGCREGIFLNEQWTTGNDKMT